VSGLDNANPRVSKNTPGGNGKVTFTDGEKKKKKKKTCSKEHEEGFVVKLDHQRELSPPVIVVYDGRSRIERCYRIR
jgi:hypothetical protein